jgi:hypothetical protein
MTEDESAKVAGMIASVSTSSMFQCCAIIGAVAERDAPICAVRFSAGSVLGFGRRPS